MKQKFIKSLILFMAIISFNTFSTFAEDIKFKEIATTTIVSKDEKKAYKAQIAILKEEIKKTNQEIKALKESNNQYQNEYKKFNTEYKANKTLTISEENFKKANELKKTIPEEEKKEVILDSETSIQTFVDNDNYNAVLNKLNINLENKRKKLETLKNINEIWLQIHELIKS